MSLTSELPQGLIVSCQAAPGSPLRDPRIMAAMARAAVMGGAVGIRACGVPDVAAIREVVAVPLIGLDKVHYPDSDVIITPTFEEASTVAAAGASVLAVDATKRRRPGAETLATLVRRIHDELGIAVMADLDNVHSAKLALETGVDLLASTLSGYTNGRLPPDGPDFDLLQQLVALDAAPVIAEGRYWTREDAVCAMNLGAHAVVIGSAITNPLAATRRVVMAIEETPRVQLTGETL